MHSQFNMPATEKGNAAANPPIFENAVIWYVAYTQPQQEKIAVENLFRQGFHTYLPLYKILKKAPRNTGALDQPNASVAYEPMFPRYMFFKPSSARQSIAAVRSTRGVNSIVKFGSTLAVVQAETLKTIQEYEENRNSADLQSITPFQPGRRVRLRHPVLNRLEGLVHSVSAQRVILLMELLGRQKKVALRHDQIELL